jgi:hypothetical protein
LNLHIYSSTVKSGGLDCNTYEQITALIKGYLAYDCDALVRSFKYTQLQTTDEQRIERYCIYERHTY